MSDRRKSDSFKVDRSIRRYKLMFLLLVLFLIILLVSYFIVVADRNEKSLRSPETELSSNDKNKNLDRPYDNHLEKRQVEKLKDFIAWLERNKVKGYVGEVGWTDEPGWNELSKRWFETAGAYDLWVTYWATGSGWGDYGLSAYDSKSNTEPLSLVNGQAKMLEDAISKYKKSRIGINVAGLEFDQGVSAENIGLVGQNYFAEKEESYKFLASRGINLVRLPIRWERLTPVLGGDFDEAYLNLVRAQIRYANKHNIDVILDLHNYGRYVVNGSTQLVLGKDEGLDDKLVELWKGLSRELGEEPGLLGYDLMNEPYDLGKGKYVSSVAYWQWLTQRMVYELREIGDNKIILIEGDNWSNINDFTRIHPVAWIKDPANNFRYEVHQYWDTGGEGKYMQSYERELLYSK